MTRVAGHVILARAAVTGIVATLVHVCLTSLAVPSWLAATGEVIDQVSALSTVHTGVAQAFIDVLLTQPASVSRFAATLESIDLVNTLSLVQTGVGLTLISVELASVAIRSQQTMTLVSTVSKLFAGATILAGVDLALIYLSVTQSTGISWVAATGEVIDAILAHSVLAKIVDTVVVVGLTSAAAESRRTVTDVRAETVSADASIVTRR